MKGRENNNFLFQKIQQLQLVVAESKQKEKISASALRRSDAAYRHMKSEVIMSSLTLFHFISHIHATRMHSL